jgi:uncharacterized protein (DUF1810 family)
MAEAEPHLSRFVRAQEGAYEQALAEVRLGRKRTHWMWFVFPQLQGLGMSESARFYGIRDAAEARAYLRHPVLGPRLEEVCRAALAVDGLTAQQIFGSPDDLKLRSCATLFAGVSAKGSVFAQVLDRYFDGQPDNRTLALLRS